MNLMTQESSKFEPICGNYGLSKITNAWKLFIQFWMKVLHPNYGWKSLYWDETYFIKNCGWKKILIKNVDRFGLVPNLRPRFGNLIKKKKKKGSFGIDPPWPSSSRASPKPHEPPNLLKLGRFKGEAQVNSELTVMVPWSSTLSPSPPFFFFSFSFLPSSRFFFLSWAVTTCCNSSFPLVRCCLLL